MTGASIRGNSTRGAVNMKRPLLMTFSIALACAALAAAQPPPASPPEGSKTLAATMNVYVFPAEGQPAEVQNREEAECYAWAVNNTKIDPFELARQAEQQMQSAEQQKAAAAQQGEGAGVKGALVGAAAGALIGEIADNDAGGGAAWGAAAGAIGGRRRARRRQQQATQEIDQQAQYQQQATARQIEDFKKAFSVCLEAKKYLVKM